jgi:hypothetical protein
LLAAVISWRNPLGRGLAALVLLTTALLHSAASAQAPTAAKTGVERGVF